MKTSPDQPFLLPINPEALGEFNIHAQTAEEIMAERTADIGSSATSGVIDRGFDVTPSPKGAIVDSPNTPNISIVKTTTMTTTKGTNPTCDPKFGDC